MQLPVLAKETEQRGRIAIGIGLHEGACGCEPFFSHAEL